MADDFTTLSSRIDALSGKIEHLIGSVTGTIETLQKNNTELWAKSNKHTDDFAAVNLRIQKLDGLSDRGVERMNENHGFCVRLATDIEEMKKVDSTYGALIERGIGFLKAFVWIGGVVSFVALVLGILSFFKSPEQLTIEDIKAAMNDPVASGP